MPQNEKPVLSDLTQITADMMGPGRSKDYKIYIDPHITPDFVKSPDTRKLPSFPIIYEIAPNTYEINEFGMANFYVLVGETRGLVIDCGCGSIDAKELIEHLCTKPYDVAITHAHGDHCGAMCQFEQVYLFPEDIPLVHDSFRVNQQLWENPNIWRSMPAGRFPDGTLCNPDDAHRGGKDYFDFSSLSFMGIDTGALPEIIPMTDEMVFDLGGGREVTVLHAPGHSKGCCVFVDLGQAVEKSPTKELFRATLHPYTKALLSAIPSTDIDKPMQRIQLKGEITSPINPKPGCRFMARCPYAGAECAEPQRLEEVMPNHFVACCKVKEINNL